MSSQDPILRSVQVLKHETEDMGLQGKWIAEFVKQHQALDREERAAWRDAQIMQAKQKRKGGQMRFRWPRSTQMRKGVQMRSISRWIRLRQN